METDIITKKTKKKGKINFVPGACKIFKVLGLCLVIVSNKNNIEKTLLIVI